jgi:hypothetical protein
MGDGGGTLGRDEQGFAARRTAERAISPLRVGDGVDVVGTAPEGERQHEMSVLIRWERHLRMGQLAGHCGGVNDLSNPGRAAVSAPP